MDDRSGEQLRLQRERLMARRPLPQDALPPDRPDWAPEPAPAEPTEERGGSSLLQEVLETILLGVVLFVAMRAVLQSTKVISRSMVPTLQEGQYLLVNKLAYRIGDVSRGDIAVFRSPQDPDLILIKRVIGLPGEEILISDHQVYVNGQDLTEPYLAPWTNASVWGPFRLGADEYLMLGDNRDNSNDSRFFGPVPGSSIIGKAWFSIWPPGGLGARAPEPQAEAATGTPALVPVR